MVIFQTWAVILEVSLFFHESQRPALKGCFITEKLQGPSGRPQRTYLLWSDL